MTPIFQTPCNLCGSMGICGECQEELLTHKLDISSGEDVCLTLNEDGGYSYKEEEAAEESLRSCCAPTGLSAWDTIRTLKPILGKAS